MAKIKDLAGMVNLAKQGDAKAAYDLGLAYDLGIGIEKDWDLSFQYYSQAAKENNAKAQYNLAICYALAKGVDKDINKSKHWIKLAQENGYSGGSGF